MHCPHCGNGDSRVVDSRDSGESVRRRRECSECEARFTTYERVQTRSLLVVKLDGRREEFIREKLLASVVKACAKRPLPIGSIEKLIEDIETQLTNMGRAEIPSKFIGEMVMEKLRELDRVAYIRFASVYRDFRDIESFRDEINALLAPQDATFDDSGQLSFLDDNAPPARRRGRRPKRLQPGPA